MNCMTFRPSDDVLEELADGQNSQAWSSQYYAYNDGYNNTYSDVSNQWIWQQDFQQIQNSGGVWLEQWNYVNSLDWWISAENVVQAINVPIEEVKAPDLSDLLQKNWGTPMDTVSFQQTSENIVATDFIVQNSVVWQNGQQSSMVAEDDFDELLEDKITDEERFKIVSWIEWSINWNLDFLVDEQWSTTVTKYKKLHRILFRWWILIFNVVIWLFLWVFAQTRIDNSNKLQIINNTSVQNRVRWIDNTPDKILSDLVGDWNLDVIVPYGFASIDWKYFQSKSNLIKYKWIIIPQLASINYDSNDLISLDDFNGQGIKRSDLENLINYLVKDNKIWNSTRKFANIADIRRIPNTFNWWLIEWFSLGCIDNFQISDLLCNKFLEAFNEYGKYYDLSRSDYSSELRELVKKLREQWKSIDPICTMVNEYVLHVGTVSDDFEYIMQYCSQDDYSVYKRMVNFIDLEKSLWQPELSDKVYEDSDLNAYKLLSAWQTIYKIVKWTTLNENYIKSYLNFVQSLLNKDNKSGRYLAPIYKDLLYVFNNDELYQKILSEWKLDLKLQMDQINNGNALYKYPWLLSQLTTSDIVVSSDSELSGGEIQEVTIESIFSQFYSMKDRLKIRSVNKISDNELVVKTELFTTKIFSVTDNQTLKLTVSLYRNGNVLYVSSIKVANQPKLSDILNIQASNWNTSFNSMLGIIDEQIWLWYEEPSDKDEQQPTLCDKLQERKDISVYNCDDSSISLYKWEIEYNFSLVNGALASFTIDDENLENFIKDKISWVMFIKDNTPTIITSIIDFAVDSEEDISLEEKIWIIDQFRIHFKIIPDNINTIDGDSENFLVNFTLWEFILQARYNVDSHLLTNISYVNCDKTLEIRWLEIPITTENEPQLTEILNNPKVFLAQSNPAAYKKYQKMCD